MADRGLEADEDGFAHQEMAGKLVDLGRNLWRPAGGGEQAAIVNGMANKRTLKRIQDWLTKKGVLPKETQGYVATITGRPAETWRTATAGAPASKRSAWNTSR